MVTSISASTHNGQVYTMPKPDKVKEFPTHYEYTYEKEASTGKKWGVGIASAVLPGLGQAVNGQWGKGLGFFAGNIGIGIDSGLFGAVGMMKGAPKALGGSMLIGTLASVGLIIGSIVDAVKNAKETITQIVPKTQENLDIQA